MQHSHFYFCSFDFPNKSKITIFIILYYYYYFASQDPALWNINSEIIDYFIRNPVVPNSKMINFDITVSKCGELNRKLPHNIFKRKLLNGDTKDRLWLLYYIKISDHFL